MKKPNDEIPTTVYAGLTSTDHTLFKQAAEAELEKMSQRLHYSENVFRLGEVRSAGTGETEAIAVMVWHDIFRMRVEVPNDSPAAFAVALEAALKEQNKYKERFEQADSEND